MGDLIQFTDKNSGYKFTMVGDNPTADHILNNGIFEYPLITWCTQFLDKDKLFIDIGAHMGTYSIILAQNSKHVYSFECQSKTFECLQKSISLNSLESKITPVNCALGEHEDTLILTKVSKDGGGSTLDSNAAKHGPSNLGTEEVIVKPLDSFNLTNVGFLKLDVEGWELEVLKGAEMTLQLSGYPKFIFEAWPDNWYMEKRQRLFDYISSLGYKIVPIAGVNNMYLAEYV